MTFAKMQERLYKSVQRDDYLATNSPDVNYGTFINEAIREIENRKSFATMKKTGDFIISAGDTSVELPVLFKTLQNLRPPVHVVFEGSGQGELLKPVNVSWAEVEYRRLWASGGRVWNVQTWIERGNSGTVPASTLCTLNIASQASEDITFRVKYYAYSAPLAGNDDESLLEQLYPRMVMTKAKEIAFDAVNDSEAFASAAAKFEILFTRASIADNYADVSGREGRM